MNPAMLNSRTLVTLFSVVTILLPALPVQASFADHPAAADFIKHMVDTHGFDTQSLQDAMRRSRHDAQVIRLITPPAQRSARSWRAYRGRFLTDARIDGGVRFWREHAETIDAASQRFGVPPEIITAIIGVETHYGGYTGTFEAVSALSTLAFDYPPRAELFRKELENLFLLAREQQRDPFSYTGSYAGALGLPQFLPSSIRNYAVDFDDDGVIDFETDVADAIGSVANYLAAHGWQPGGTVAIPVRLPASLDPTPLIEAGIDPVLDASDLRAQGIRPVDAVLLDAPSTLIDLVTPNQATEYWLGYRNFYVITRYNRSSFYAMSVFQLAEAIRERHARVSAALGVTR